MPTPIITKGAGPASQIRTRMERDLIKLAVDGML